MSVSMMLTVNLSAYPDARVIEDESGGGEVQEGIFIPLRGAGLRMSRKGNVIAKFRVSGRAVEEKGEREFDVLAYLDGEYQNVGGGYYLRKHGGYCNVIEVIND